MMMWVGPGRGADILNPDSDSQQNLLGTNMHRCPAKSDQCFAMASYAVASLYGGSKVLSELICIDVQPNPIDVLQCVSASLAILDRSENGQ